MGAVDAQQSDAGTQGTDTPTVQEPATSADALKARVEALAVGVKVVVCAAAMRIGRQELAVMYEKLLK